MNTQADYAEAFRARHFDGGFCRDDSEVRRALEARRRCPHHGERSGLWTPKASMRNFTRSMRPGGSPPTQAFAGRANGVGVANQATISAGGALTVEKPTRIFGQMHWIGIFYTTFGGMWNQIKAAGGDGLLLSLKHIVGAGGSPVSQSLLDLPTQEGPSTPMFAGFYMSNYYNYWCPVVQTSWWDDSAWATQNATWALEIDRLLSNGYLGITIDMENYPGYGPNGETTGNAQNPGLWDGATAGAHFGFSIAATNAKTYQRGAEWATAIKARIGADVLKLAVYGNRFANNWDSVQHGWQPYTPNDSYGLDLNRSWWAGVASVSGAFKELTFLEAADYKDTQVPHWPRLGTSDPPASWATALFEDVGFYRTMAQTYFNDGGLAPRIHLAPFSWIDEDCTNCFDQYRGFPGVMDQITNFAHYVQDPRNYGSMIVDYSYNSFGWPYNNPRPDEPPPGILPAFGKFSRRLGTAPASY